MRRAWALHATVLVVVLATPLLVMAYAEGGSDNVSFRIFFAILWIPFALLHTLLSTVMVGALRPGRSQVALAHGIGLTLAALVISFVMLRSAPHH